MMVMPNPASWKGEAGEGGNYSVIFFAYSGFLFSFKTQNTILHTKIWETLLVTVVLF